MKTLALAFATAAALGLAAVSLGAAPANAAVIGANNAAQFNRTDVVPAHYRRYHRRYHRHRHCWWRYGHRYCRWW